MDTSINSKYFDHLLQSFIKDEPSKKGLSTLFKENFLGIKLEGSGIKPPQTATFDEVIIIFEFFKRIYTDTILQEKVQTNLVINRYAAGNDKLVSIGNSSGKQVYTTKLLYDDLILTITPDIIAQQAQQAKAKQDNEEKSYVIVSKKPQDYKQLFNKPDNCRIISTQSQLKANQSSELQANQSSDYIKYSYAGKIMCITGRTKKENYDLEDEHSKNLKFMIDDIYKKFLSNEENNHVILFVFGITGSGKDTFLNTVYGTILNNEQIHDTEPKLELDNSNVNSSSQSTTRIRKGTISIDFNSNTQWSKKILRKSIKKANI